MKLFIQLSSALTAGFSGAFGIINYSGKHWLAVCFDVCWVLMGVSQYMIAEKLWKG